MIRNINYVGQALESVSHLDYRKTPPYMHVCKCANYTLVIFKCGKCRLMGCRQPLLTRILLDGPVKIAIQRIQSVTVTFDMKSMLKLSHLGNFCHRENIRYLYEPELFPALRLSTFDPICVNVFASGKCVVLGIKHLCYQKYVKRIMHLINRSECMLPTTTTTITTLTVLKNAKSIREDDFTSNKRNTTETQGLCETKHSDSAIHSSSNVSTTTTTTTTTIII